MISFLTFYPKGEQTFSMYFFPSSYYCHPYFSLKELEKRFHNTYEGLVLDTAWLRFLHGVR